MKAVRTLAVSLLLLTSLDASAQDCVPPRILFVVDASFSMTNELMGVTKWEAAQSAIQAVLDAHGSSAEYGLMTFPGPAGQCSTGQVMVDVAAGTGDTILSTLAGMTLPGNAQTPAGQTLNAAASYAGITDPAHDNYVIFITDGYQYCSVESGTACATAADCTAMGVSPCPSCLPDATDGCYCVQDWTIRGASALADQGVNTYVVGFGDAVNFRVLNETASVGNTALAGCDPTSTMASCYYQATAPTELTTALSGIVQGVVTAECSNDCGLLGERTCTLAGWSECDAPSSVACTSSCDTDGTQECVDGSLTECSAEADCGEDMGPVSLDAGPEVVDAGSDEADAGSETDAGSIPPSDLGTGTTPGGSDGGCGCRVTAAPRVSQAPLWLILGFGILLWRRRA